MTTGHLVLRLFWFCHCE